MSRFVLAVRLFFQALSGKIDAARAEALTAAGSPSPSPAPVTAASPKPDRRERSDAVNLLAALQRDARFVDLVQESLADYSDEQIGAAARDVLRDCRATLQKIFALKPVLDQPESAQVEVHDAPDTGRIRLTGNVTGQPPYRGQLVHHGWQATQCKLPTWTGSSEATGVVAPAEIELPTA